MKMRGKVKKDCLLLFFVPPAQAVFIEDCVLTWVENFTCGPAAWQADRVAWGNSGVSPPGREPSWPNRYHLTLPPLPGTLGKATKNRLFLEVEGALFYLFSSSAFESGE